jgi:hypothetical protein
MTSSPTYQADNPKATARWHADAVAISVLSVFLALSLWNRFHFDSWLARYDLMTYFLPSYAYLGDRLRDFEVPGWNPHLFSGAPFAGDPESGWMYFPAMISFALFHVSTAFKVMVGIQLAVAALSTYAYARVLGMRPVAALLSAVIFTFGPLLQWNSYCCLIFGQYVIWIPLALLGIELALRADSWRTRLAPWCVTGFAVSQMFAGWIGEGWIYIPIYIGAYVGYRALLAPSQPDLPWHMRLTNAVTTGMATLGLGIALGAAGIWPRVAANAESNLAGARYGEIGAQGILNPPWDLDYLFRQIIGSDYASRRAALGGVAIVLTLLAPIIAGKRFAIPFFLPLTIVAFILALDTTPLHHVFYLIPRYRELHEHDPWRTVSLATLGPAVLSGATVEELCNWRRGRQLLPIVVIPLFLLVVIAALAFDGYQSAWIPAVIAAAITTMVVAFAASMPHRSERSPAGKLLVWVPVLLIAVAFVQPTALEFTSSWLRWPNNESWERLWRPDPIVKQTLASEVSGSDPGGAGEFLQTELATGGPFRYVGYGGIGFPNDAQRQANYMGRRFESTVHAILVNGRPTFLNLYEIQGYNPLQLLRYSEFMTALNGREQNYHTAFLLYSGVRSPLIDLLNVRFVLVDATIPQDREDVVGLTQGRREVFRSPLVVVYERIDPLPHAWIVHDVRSVERGEALPLLVDGTVDPFLTALIEGELPVVAAADGSAVESAPVTRYEPERITITTTTGSAGVLVVSEVYEKGWHAYLDGERVNVMPTDHALRGVAIPAGEHTVEMRYEPLSLRLGLPISGITAFAMVAVLAWTGSNRRRKQPGPHPNDLGESSL